MLPKAQIIYDEHYKAYFIRRFDTFYCFKAITLPKDTPTGVAFMRQDGSWSAIHQYMNESIDNFLHSKISAEILTKEYNGEGRTTKSPGCCVSHCERDMSNENQ